MSTVRLAITELRRVTSGTLPKLAVLALVIVPLLYGSLYLYANADPYGRLDKIPAAVVVADTGDNGRQVADKLRESGAFEWHEVDAAEAESGVRDGRYTFSLTLPQDFSAALASSGNFQPRQGFLTVTTNDANNYLVGTIADKVISEVRKSITSEVGSEAAERFLVGFATIYDKTREAADGATKLADGAVKARDGAGQLAGGGHELAAGQRQLYDGSKRLADGATRAAAGAGELSGGLNTLRDKTKPLPEQTAKLADGARQVAAGNERVAQTGEQVAGAAQTFVDHIGVLDAKIADALRKAGLPEAEVQRVLAQIRPLRGPVDEANGKVQGVAKDLRKLADGAHQVSDGAGKLAAATPALTGGIGQAADGARQLGSGTVELRDGAVKLRDGEKDAVTGADKLAGGADALRDGTVQLAGGSTQLRDGLAGGLDQIPHPDPAARDATAKTIADPVAVQQVSDAKAGSYGAGLAPFFLGLATWIGAFVLFLLLRPLSARALAAGHSAVRTAIAGWLPPAVLGLAQVTIMYAVVTLVVGVDVAHPVATLGFLALTSLAFVAIVQALGAALGSVGKFVALVVLILQLISAGGTFPWQTLPDPLYPLHAVLPMGYVVDGLRHLLYGGSLSSLGLDVGVLLAWLVGALAVTVLAARRDRVWTPSRLKPELVL
ncbi:putative membrane protein [Herbihabitans rhizosphaerae]|uniref:Putative membrane protein n=1 Tax=Herbihabitans rhizosphaerae TaxID=1872711 RepID=A0A4Q7KIC0_9PSEU|nr:YhgE/Pip domain-containing protein [Herbihabitans rhizosphaerae]RZS34929.1 putative membrane protein [Herbihabitans rhizosphaerae]